MTFTIAKPYVIFLGDAPDDLSAKVGDGIAKWRCDDVVGQICLPDCKADLGVPKISIDDAKKAGAKTLVIGVANRGGVISKSWIDVLLQALESGLDIASGLHNRLTDIEALVEKAAASGQRLLDVRVPQVEYPIGGAMAEGGRRVLTVGTDCSVGKMFTSLAVEKCMRDRGIAADFRATGQTGILITGSGVPLDAVVADFMSGAVETLSPAAAAEHWDVIEGQGSLWHPSFSGVSLGLLHGARADSLILCHEPTRAHMRGLPHYPIADIAATIAANEMLGKRTHQACKVVGIAVNSAAMAEDEAKNYLSDLEAKYNLPATDAYRFGADKLVDALLARSL